MKTLRFLKTRQILIGAVILFTSTLGFQTQAQSSAPAVGDTLDLTSFRSQKGQTLAQAINTHSLAMMVLVDPNCGTCTAAKDSLRNLRDRVEKAGITYYVLMLPAEGDAQKYFAYADSLNLAAESFVWSSVDSKPPGSLTTLSMPSHILVTNEGLVVDKWSGIEKSAGNRENMVNRIASEAVARLRSRQN
jgi:hypothetical protein